MRRVLVVTALAGLALVLAADTAQAQLFRRGGGGGGGFGGGFGSGWGNTGYGNFGNYGGYQGWGNQPGYWGSNSWGYGQPYMNNYYNSTGHYTTPGFYSNTPGHYYTNPGYYSSNQQNFGYTQPFNSAFTSTQGTAQQSFYSGPGQDNTQATIHIHVPNPSARVWIEGQEMPQQGGTERVFISPPLQRGSQFVYTIRSAWDENGRQVTREHKLPVTAGQQVAANFTDGNDQQRFNGPQDRQQLQNNNAPQANPANQPQAQPFDQRNNRPAAQGTNPAPANNPAPGPNRNDTKPKD